MITDRLKKLASFSQPIRGKTKEVHVLCRLHACASDFDWLTGLSVSFVIGWRDCFGFGFYSSFHRTFDKRFPKFAMNWQFHYVVVNQIVNFETKL